MQSEPNAAFDPNDPHGFADLGEHHGHHIASARTLIVVISTLVVLTALTVVASEIETYLTSALGWYLPDWVNVAVAMSIALVKGVLVLMFFMALKYENPLYTIVFLFCMFAFALFLGLTGMDLDNRGHVYEWKSAQITAGGLGGSVAHPGATITDYVTKEKFVYEPAGFSGPLTEHLKAQYIAATGITEAEYMKRWAKANHVHLEDPAHTWSDADRTVGRVGLSGALDEHADHADDHHDDGH